MVLLSLPISFFIALISACFTTIFTLCRLRDHAITTLILLSTDFGIAILLPFTLITLVALGVGLAERLFLSSVMFYLALLVGELLFPDTSAKFSHPFTVAYLVFAVVLLLPAFSAGSLELGLVLFGYQLSDNITLAAVIFLSMSALASPFKQVALKMYDLVDLRHFENMRRDIGFKVTNSIDTRPPRINETGGNTPFSHPLKRALKLLKEREYESCLELCDMEVERFIASKLLRLSPTKLDAPLTIEEQLSSLSSKGILLDEESITHLRRLRNNIAVSSGRATRRQAKWAVQVLRSTLKQGPRLRKGTLTE